MRPGLKEWFEAETAPLCDKSIPYSVRLIRWKRLIQAQQGVIRVQTDGSITSPISPDEVNDAVEYLERLKNFKVPL